MNRRLPPRPAPQVRELDYAKRGLADPPRRRRPLPDPVRALLFGILAVVGLGIAFAILCVVLEVRRGRFFW